MTKFEQGIHSIVLFRYGSAAYQARLVSLKTKKQKMYRMHMSHAIHQYEQ